MKRRKYIGLMLIMAISLLLGVLSSKVRAEEEEISASINGKVAGDCLKLDEENTHWIFRYEKDFRNDPMTYLKSDTSQCLMKWKNHDEPGSNYQNGLYGEAITFPFDFNRPIIKLNVHSEVGNYADSIRRTAFIEYSLDNITFISLAKKEFGSEVVKFEGEIDFTGKNVRKIWIRICFAKLSNVINGSNVVLHGIDIKAMGNTTKE